eukprot:225811-Rhodomonas_salina.1
MILFPQAAGGMQLMTPTTVALKEVSAHLQRCTLYDDAISDQVTETVRYAFSDTLCNDLPDLLDEASHLSSKMCANTILLWVALAHANGVRVAWDRV